MSYEVRDRDLLARIGRLHTKSGTIETPLLFPVVNPTIQPIPPSELREKFGFEALITNAYILRKRFGEQPAKMGIHDFLNFNGVVMTDSGAYQLLIYGELDVKPEEIVAYQEQINVDIATILDVPTGWNVKRSYAEETVNETIRRAKELFKIKTRGDILWVGPIQGGRFTDLVVKSAREMGKLPFQIHALGSPTRVMENYRFDVLVDMIMAAKMNIPPDRPLHLFGAGHPMMFSLAVALGCDLFDSASYALYAKDGRYMTEMGTARLNELEYFPCSCPACSRSTPEDVRSMTKVERERFLAEHNLYACISEIKRIKQAIREGRLWEHLTARSYAHPSLLQAIKKLDKFKEFIERHSPVSKPSGLFFYSGIDLVRPEVVRHCIRLRERYTKPPKAEILILIPQTRVKPLHKTSEFKKLEKAIKKAFNYWPENIHVCAYDAPFGVIPMELDETYPLSQHETTFPLDAEIITYVAQQSADYVYRMDYRVVVLLHSPEDWGDAVLKAVEERCRVKGIKFKYFELKDDWEKMVANFLSELLGGKS
ncbi:MAG: tRNA guanosine(15) transglycosylase TgtA [Candidatus Bathyarchaeia archaeon]